MSNFAFLKPEWPAIYEAAEKAADSVTCDPRTTLPGPLKRTNPRADFSKHGGNSDLHQSQSYKRPG
jgi:hypothetical protein